MAENDCFKIEIAGNLKIRTEYCLEYRWNDGNGGGFAFPCTKDGVVELRFFSEPLAYRNYLSCNKGEFDVVCDGVKEYVYQTRLCDCGSMDESWPEHDARGIFLCRVCDNCKQDKLSKYRPEVLTDSNYYTDEPIDEPD